LRLFRTTPPNKHAAFRLSQELLATIDSICDQLDITRSQFFRHALTDRVKSYTCPIAHKRRKEAMVTRTVRPNATEKIKHQGRNRKPKRRLRRYRDVVGNIRYQPRKHLTLRESSDQADAIADLRYFVTGLPKNASQMEKSKILEELANTVGNIDTSDVFVISIVAIRKLIDAITDAHKKVT
jgi:hypothetical protein